ncbi:MAG: SPOR domain-containing protein [Bacteroidota bacterium]
MGLNVDIYLRNAFKELDAFSLPEIGTFRKVHLSAKLDEFDQIVFPPRVEIEFSPQADMRLSLLRYLTHQIQMPGEEAEKIIADICSEIESQLNANGRFDLEEIGTLYRDNLGYTTFRADQQAKDTFSSDYFGLHPVKMTPDAAEIKDVEVKEQARHPEDLPVKETEKRNTNNRSGFTALTTVLVLLLVSTIGFALYQTNSMDNFFRFTRASIQEDSYLAMAVSEESLEAFDSMANLEESFEENEGENSSEQANEKTKQAEEVNKASNRASLTESVASSNKQDAIREPSGDSDAVVYEDVESQRTRSLQSIGLPRGGSTTTDQADSSTDKLITGDPRARLAGPSSVFHLVAGSFTKSSRANTFKKELVQEGFQNIQIIHSPEVNAYRVSIFQSDNAELVQQYKQVLEEDGRKSGWIFEEKN